MKELILKKKSKIFPKKKKGTVDYDFILSIGLFAVAYVSLFTLLPYINMSSIDSADSLLQESNYLSTILAKYPGYPKNWTSISNVKSIGLSYYDNTTYYPNILDLTKIKQIATAGCTSLKPKTGTTINLLISIKLNNGSSYNCTSTKPNYSREIQRPVMVYDNNGNYEPGILELYTW